MTGGTTTSGTNTPHVTICLSTFNGSAFLQAQLDSLFAQSHSPMAILARDDGSSDGTRTILERARNDGRLTVLPGSINLGAAPSFFELLRQASATQTDMVAFCDQDDVWSADKLARAVAALGPLSDVPALYCSRLEVVDAGLAPLSMTAVPGRIGFGNALVENIAVGCTAVLNRKAVDLIAGNIPDGVPVHDWWCYLVVSCFGKIVFDDEPGVKYRQHAHNAFGAASGTIDRIGRKIRRFAGDSDARHWQSTQAKIFLDIFGAQMPAGQRAVVEDMVRGRSSFARRVLLAFGGGVWRQHWWDGMALRALILLNRY